MSIGSKQFIDIFSDDAFSLGALTAAINEIDHVPGRAGELVFAAISEGVETLDVSIERLGGALSLIRTSVRGGPAPQETQDKRSLLKLHIPQIKLEDTIHAHEIQDVRETFGGPQNAAGLFLRGVQEVVNTQMRKMARRHDLTVEHHRLGALKGVIRDADGSVLVDLFEEFAILNGDGFVGPETFDFALDDPLSDVRLMCMEVDRFIRRKAKMIVPTTAAVWAFCGDEFFNKLISHQTVKRAYSGTDVAAQRLGENYAFGVFEHGGIFFENYQGTDDGEMVSIAPDEARLFLTGVPGLYAEYFAPADFMETVNTPGLPRYAKLAPDVKFQKFVELHTQQNPLPICLRPQTLIRGVVTTEEPTE